MKREDLTTVRPWVARPETPESPESPWEVVAPSRYDKGKTVLVAYRLSERDARAIAAAGNETTT